MTPFATAIVIAAVLLIVSGVLFFRGIITKNLKIFTWAVALLLAAGCMGAYGVFVLLRHTVTAWGK